MDEHLYRGARRPGGRHQAGHRIVPAAGRGLVVLDDFGVDVAVVSLAPLHLQLELEAVVGGGRDVDPAREVIRRARSQATDSLANNVVYIFAREVLPGKAVAVDHFAAARERDRRALTIRPVVGQGVVVGVKLKAGVEQQIRG